MINLHYTLYIKHLSASGYQINIDEWRFLITAKSIKA